MKKRIMTLLALVLILSLVPAPAYAASSEATTSANALHELGLFNGTGIDTNGNPIFDLDRTPTRNEAITMLVRLLGKESEAQSKEWTTPFIDVTTWAKPYVGYSYNNGLTTGTSSTTYGGDGIVTPAQYLTFVLRALGYKDNDDFQWNKAWLLSDKIGLTNGQYNESTTSFTRGDVAIISYRALSCKLNGTDTALLDDLTARGVIKENENTTPNNPDIAEDGHIHQWETVHIPGSGHYDTGGTHKVMIKKCNCGFTLSGDTPNADGLWSEHGLTCRQRYIYWYEDVPNHEPVYVEDWPAKDVTYCPLCGAEK